MNVGFFLTTRALFLYKATDGMEMFGIKVATVSKTIQKPLICSCLQVFLSIVERPLKLHLNPPVKTEEKDKTIPLNFL